MARDLSKREFMDYKQLKELLDYTPTNGMYEELMKKETDVLRTINRVVDYSNKKELEAQEMINMPASRMYKHLGTTLYTLFNDLFEAKDAKDIVAAFRAPDRIVCSGIVVVLVALFLFFVSISN